jgi:maleamate amidohydrolase
MSSDVAPQQHSLQERALREFYEQRGFAGRVGFGRTPAVLVIDLAKAWTDTNSPIGTDLSKVISHSREIADVARAKGVPIFFTTMAYEADMRDCGSVVVKKVPLQRMMVKGSEWVELDPAVGAHPEDVLIVKQRASAFFGTSFLSQLVAHNVDTLIITGCSTSGCVRATAQDAHDTNLHVIIPKEAVGDRSPTAHEANLFDIDARMGDVVNVANVLEYINGLARENHQ